MIAQPRLVVGIDPGLARTGYGLVRQQGDRLQPVVSGTIETPEGAPQTHRLVILYRAVAGLLEQHRPQLVAVERLFVNRNLRSVMAVGQARGVILLAVGQAGVPLVEFTPQAVKSALTGQGRGTKAQVGYMVQALLGLPQAPMADEGDALAMAICGAWWSESGACGPGHWQEEVAAGRDPDVAGPP